MTAADVEVGLSAAWYGLQGPLISNDEVAEFVAESEGRPRGAAGAGLTRPIQAVRELRMGRERTRVRGPADGALVVTAPAHRPALLALVFHHMVKEAEAFAADLPDVGAQLHAADPELYPRTIWADRLCGEHKPNHRRRVLGEFASGIATDGTVVEKGFLGSVKVLGEGVDTKNCDSVYWADVRGSCPTSSRPWVARCGCSRVRGRWPAWSCRSCSGRARRRTTCSPAGQSAGWRSCWRGSGRRRPVVEQLAEQQAPNAHKPVQKRAGPGEPG
ncbi:hypothetical protein [Streptomyces sp. NRRL S-1022]|uniref:hypothetical protein n=1 Tax=Streptomyces sp. NRRL S-1022 TaxID=1463880 RepID=UPI000AA46E02